MKLPLNSNLCILAFCLLFLSSCSINFKGTTIPPDVKTYTVENFTLSSSAAPIDINQKFTEELRRKIREESRLVNNDENPDIIFTGTITGYGINYVAPDPNNTTSLNRLEISVKINYTNEKNEEDNYSKSYSDFEDFDSNSDFQSIQDDLIDTIIEDILERAFNDAFTRW